ncbi:hypothetical protein Tsubulata_005566 [Turnera subulata]|uniref:Uncharacterized protein n=1 Tax=Turnera subulata TaxID=218843 RepID=A0A9Q0F2J5_9ROSI|nr:hypothetical protein Tsubulata_005566 [Turnera subulata]
MSSTKTMNTVLNIVSTLGNRQRGWLEKAVWIAIYYLLLSVEMEELMRGIRWYDELQTSLHEPWSGLSNMSRVLEPYEDTLVITTVIERNDVARILIDDGRSIYLNLIVGTAPKLASVCTNLLVYKRKRFYNAIIGRPIIHKLQAIPSTLYQRKRGEERGRLSRRLTQSWRRRRRFGEESSGGVARKKKGEAARCRAGLGGGADLQRVEGGRRRVNRGRESSTPRAATQAPRQVGGGCKQSQGCGSPWRRREEEMRKGLRRRRLAAGEDDNGCSEEARRREGEAQPETYPVLAAAASVRGGKQWRRREEEEGRGGAVSCWTRWWRGFAEGGGRSSAREQGKGVQHATGGDSSSSSGKTY